MYYGRIANDGRILSAGKFFDGTLGVYDPRDGEFHYDPRHEKMYYEGEYDEISDADFAKFKAEIDKAWKWKSE